jgi:hypothetical protein
VWVYEHLSALADGRHHCIVNISEQEHMNPTLSDLVVVDGGDGEHAGDGEDVEEAEKRDSEGEA